MTVSEANLRLVAAMLGCADYYRTKAEVIRHDSQESARTRHYDDEAARCEAKAREWETKPLTYDG